MRHATLFDAAAYLMRAHYVWDQEYKCFIRGSWQAHITVFKNGTARTRCY